MRNNEYAWTPRGEHEWLERQYALDAAAERRAIELENNGEFLTVDPETGCMPAEMDSAEPPAPVRPQQMSLFDQEVPRG